MNPNRPGTVLLEVVALISLAVGAATFLLWATAQGVGVSPDSTVYLEAAKSVLSGHGLEVAGKPMTHYPPLYPLALAVAGMIAGGDMAAGARLLHTLLFGLNAVLVGLVARKLSGRGVALPALAMLLFMVSPAVIQIHWMAWSEPLFLALVLLLGLSLARFLECGKHMYLIAASILGGLMLVTRYAGISLLPAVFLLLALGRARPLAHRLRDGLWAAALIGAPLAGWLFRNMQVARTATNRALAFHPPGVTHARELLDAVAEFVVPFRVSLWLTALALAGCALVLVLALRRALGRRLPGSSEVAGLPTQVTVFATFGLCYMTFLLLSITFFDAATPLDSRMLLPAVVSFAIAAGGVVAKALAIAPSRIMLLPALLCAGGLICLNALSAVFAGERSRDEGIGFSSIAWKRSATVVAVAGMAQPLKIYSNGADVLSFLTGTAALSFPERVNPTSQLPNPRYGEQVKAMIEQCRAGTAIIVQVEKVDWRWYLPSGSQLAREYDLPIHRKLEDGSIYCVPQRAVIR